jgi:hypothetical protein
MKLFAFVSQKRPTTRQIRVAWDSGIALVHRSPFDDPGEVDGVVPTDLHTALHLAPHFPLGVFDSQPSWMTKAPHHFHVVDLRPSYQEPRP